MRKIPSYIKDILERITKYNGKLIKLNVALNKYFDSKRINFDAFDDFGCALANIQDGEVEELEKQIERQLDKPMPEGICRRMILVKKGQNNEA